MQFKMPKKLFVNLLLISLTSCAANTTETVRTVHDYCLIAKGISYAEAHGTDVEDTSNKYDTSITIQQIKDHDLAFEKVCETEKNPKNN
jgi:hypothetical protein